MLTAASTLAGLWSLGSASMEMTLIRMVSTVCTGSQRSSAFSYPHLSSPGSWRIDMHTSPFFSTALWWSFKWQFSNTERKCVCVCVCMCMCVCACVCVMFYAQDSQYSWTWRIIEVNMCMLQCFINILNVLDILTCKCSPLTTHLNSVCGVWERKHNLPLGCHISEINFIFGGRCGYSLGNIRWALKYPPSLIFKLRLTKCENKV